MIFKETSELLFPGSPRQAQRSSKPVIGDTVHYLVGPDRQPYVVRQVGLKMLEMAPRDNPDAKPSLVYIKDITWGYDAT